MIQQRAKNKEKQNIYRKSNTEIKEKKYIHTENSISLNNTPSKNKKYTCRMGCGNQ